MIGFTIFFNFCYTVALTFLGRECHHLGFMVLKMGAHVTIICKRYYAALERPQTTLSEESLSGRSGDRTCYGTDDQMNAGNGIHVILCLSCVFFLLLI